MAEADVFLERALLETGLISHEQLATAREHAASRQVDVFEAMTNLEYASRREIAMVKADLCESPFIDLTDYEPSIANTRAVPRSIAERFDVFPLFIIDGVMTLAMVDPLNIDASDQVRQIARCEVDPLLADRDQLQSLISRAYSLSHVDSDLRVEDEAESDSDAEISQPVVAAVNQILSDAIDVGASDIHVNPDETRLHLRFRLDGVLQSKQAPPLSMHSGIVQRLKVMANLDLTQTRRPQDGKFRFRRGGRKVDIRMSTIPTVVGENVVLRLLAGAQAFHGFRELGMPAEPTNQIERLLAEPYGMILVTGPTGSGKTTTLYTALAKLNDPKRNIMTIEDPVEIRMRYVRQVQVHAEIGLTFASALRSMLRQDPDVVLVGEVRDQETASIAVQAALTGHMVLSTLHTNDAAGAISRLRDYGLPPFVINSSLLGIVAQRLVRKTCIDCAAVSEPDEYTRLRFALRENSNQFMVGSGCARCGQTGYRGRMGIYELLTLSSGIRRLIEESASIESIRNAAVSEGMQLMWQDGLAKAALGQTTLAEVAKVASIVEVDPHADARADVKKVAA